MKNQFEWAGYQSEWGVMRRLNCLVCGQQQARLRAQNDERMRQLMPTLQPTLPRTEPHK